MPYKEKVKAEITHLFFSQLSIMELYTFSQNFPPELNRQKCS